MLCAPPPQRSAPSMDQFIVLGRVGEGAHGVVFKAKDRETGELVALKKVPLRRPEEPLPPQTLREIKALREIGDHPHVVRLRCAFAQGPAIVLAFDFLVGDLGGLLRATPTPLSPPRVRALVAMTLRGLSHCHRLHVLHRDLKPANLLLDARGWLKLGDFGLARVLAPPGARPYSHQVATRWYRAPELLYGARHYDEGVDLWAVGCIFGELLNLSPLFPGENDIEQLCCVLRALGTPSPRAWPELSALPDFPKIRFRRVAAPPLELLVPGAEPLARDLLRRLLRYPARSRPRAHQALLHPYFFGPMELSPPPLPGGPRGPPPFQLDTPILPSLPPPDALGPPAPRGPPRSTPTLGDPP
ncbi:cyclin-dependent kinase 20 [Cuculus canorus]|uniref:cyclin-dependent kinase 20 n=1 Tax=Cuculus canorus TaxID=55661 RepID=UPI0023AA7D45|nr:cyclin-dependent kinase 20 [Cuculus canorus]